MDRQRKITSLRGRKKAPECVCCPSREGREGGANQMGPFRDPLRIKSWAEKRQKDEDQFQCFFPTCQTSLMDVLTVIKTKQDVADDSFRRAASGGMKREPVNPQDSHWATEGHLQDTWYCIFPLRYISTAVSSALTGRDTSSALPLSKALWNYLF